MKRLLFTLLLSGLFITGYAQKYYPFLNNSNWYQSDNRMLGTYYYWYHSAGDTLISGKKYTIINKDDMVTVPTLAGYVREDALQQKVWIIRQGETTESLLYDFSLSIGSQYTFLDFWGYPNIATLLSIDSVNTGLGKVRRFYYQVGSVGGHHFYALEGIGSLDNPIEMGNYSLNEQYFLLTSAYQNCSKTYGADNTPNPYNNCNPIYFTADILIQKNISYCGNCDGAAYVTLQGGKKPYSYHWSNGQTIDTLNNLCAGAYSVTVTDNANHTELASISITDPHISLSILQTIPASTNNCDGKIAVKVMNGTPPYAYIWSDAAGNSLNGAFFSGNICTITGLCPGNYYVTITDATVCTGSASSTNATVNHSIPTVNIINTSTHCGLDNARAIAIASGGQWPYYYHWSTGETTLSIKGLAVGTYTVTVTDSLNNSKTANTIVNAVPSPTIILAAQPVSCFGGDDGNITTLTTGGNQPFNYQWSNTATTGNISGIATGTYTITVTDANTCIVTAIAVVTEPTGIKTHAYSIQGSTFASVNVSGGSPPYSYTWSNGKTTSTITGLATGKYYVTIYDKQGCTAKDSAIVDNHAFSIQKQSNIIENIRLYPNPVNNGILNVDYKEPIERIEVYNLLGQLVLQSKASKIIDVSDLEKGMYSVILSDKQSRAIRKIVIQ